MTTINLAPIDLASIHNEGTASQTLKALLDLKSIAVIGASEDQTKFGGRLFKNLIQHGYKGKIYPINPARDTLFGIPTYPELAATPTAPDAFVLALPSNKVKEQVEIAAKLGVKLGIIISSGFSDAGPAGRLLEEEIVEIARKHGMRLMGPNCLGMVSAQNGIILCSSPVLDRDNIPMRSIGFVSQSGALMTTFFDRAWSSGSGFTHGFSVGNQGDLELCDFVDYLIEDDATTVICAYIEGLKDTPRFLATARKARQAGKPLLVVKAGRSKAGQQAAFSHTASVTGDAAVFAAVCEEEGVVVVEDINTMLTVANVLASQPRQLLKSVAILTPSGGGGALAADALSDAAIDLAEFEDGTKQALSGLYPAGQAQNPVDFGTRLGTDVALVARQTLIALQEDANTDVILCVMAMCPLDWQLSIVNAQGALAQEARKPILFALDAGVTADPVRKRLAELNIPYANSTSEAVKTLVYLKKWGQLAPRQQSDRPEACASSSLAGLSGQLDEHQTKVLLSQYGIPVNAGMLAQSEDEAAAHALHVGLPVVMKIVSPDIIHKSDVGGVIIRLNSEEEVRKAYHTIISNARTHLPDARVEGVFVQRMVEGNLELIVGARNDKEFGPIVVYGAGGVLVELLPDKVIARAPVSKDDVLSGLASLAIWPVLSSYRGKSLAVDALVDAVQRLSWLAWDLRHKNFEIDINPLIVSISEVTAVDGRLQVTE